MFSTVGVASAATNTCPPHGPYGNGVTILNHWTSSHRLGTGKFLNGSEIYEVCYVNHEAYKYDTYCKSCGKVLYSETADRVISHSHWKCNSFDGGVG